MLELTRIAISQGNWGWVFRGMSEWWEELETGIFEHVEAPAPVAEPPKEQGRLVVLVGDEPGRSYVVKQEFVIGRAPDAALQINKTDVSRYHAKIYRHEKGLMILDLNSRNGTRVNSVPVKTKILVSGDRITIGSSAIILFSYLDSLEEQLLQSQKMESLGRLAGGIAHDFNNLLGTALTNFDYLRRLPLDQNLSSEEVRSALSDSEEALKRAAQLTKQLLGFARKGKYQERPIDLSELGHEVVRMIRRTVDRAVAIETQIEPAQVVVGDGTQLHQVLMNLCINASDAMPKGGKLAIRLRGELPVRRAPEPLHRQAHVVLEVEDNGVGMSEAARERAFEPFFTTKPVGQGTGLGLAMVYGIVRNHGGQVQVESAEGEGTVVRITLPRASQAPARESRPDGALILMSERQETILLVDDEDLVRKSTARLLVSMGYTVLTASGGDEALTIYKEKMSSISVVLLDLLMPKMSGEQTYQALLELDPSVRVVILSGYSDEVRAQQVLSAGARGFISKPFTVGELKKALDTAQN